MSGAYFVCPSCNRDVDYLRDGVCLACHYTTLGGDLAPDDLLRGEWDAWLWPSTTSAHTEPAGV